MVTGGVEKLFKVLRISMGAVSIVFGILVLVAGVIGSEPVRIGSDSHKYYQIVASPPSQYITVGIVALAIGAFLFALPALFGKRQ